MATPEEVRVCNESVHSANHDAATIGDQGVKPTPSKPPPQTNQGSSTCYKSLPDSTMSKNRRPPLEFHEIRDILLREQMPIALVSVPSRLTGCSLKRRTPTWHANDHGGGFSFRNLRNRIIEIVDPRVRPPSTCRTHRWLTLATSSVASRRPDRDLRPSIHDESTESRWSNWSASCLSFLDPIWVSGSTV